MPLSCRTFYLFVPLGWSQQWMVCKEKVRMLHSRKSLIFSSKCIHRLWDAIFTVDRKLLASFSSLISFWHYKTNLDLILVLVYFSLLLLLQLWFTIKLGFEIHHRYSIDTTQFLIISNIYSYINIWTP